MPPHSAIADRPFYRDLRRQTLAFSVLSLLACVVVVAVFEPPALQGNRVATLDLLTQAGVMGRRFTWLHAPALLGVGTVAGLLAGMLGMGGGVLKVAGMLIVLQLDILLARAVSLTTMFLATASASVVHFRQGTVQMPVVRAMLVPATVGVVVGMLAGHLLPRLTLTHFFGFFVLFLGFNTFAHTVVDPDERSLDQDPMGVLTSSDQQISAGIGGLHGFVCGLLGISGGVVAVPLQQAFIRVPARNAVANSVVVSAWSTAFGSIAAILSGHLRGDFHLADLGLASLCIGAGAIAGAQVGARVTRTVPPFVLRLAFVFITFSAGLAILFK